MKKCLDEAILQAYIDGELPREQAAAAAQHVAACDACAGALAEAESESAFFSTAFAPDDSVSVPTGALRARIGAAVAQLESQAETEQASRRGPSFGGFFASLSAMFTFTPQSAAAFAGVLVAVAAGVVYFSAQKSRKATDAPRGGQEIAKVSPAPELPAEVTPTPDAPAPASNAGKGTAAATPVKLDNAGARRASLRNAPARRTAAPAAPKEEALPGEQAYQTAIASLERTIKLGGDASLRPSVRVEYERNLAVIDSAIVQTRQVAARNPEDKDAVAFLLSAYQSKVELLTKVADEAQVTALGR